MKTQILSIIAAMGIAAAQQVVAPTTEPVGEPRGENYENYNFTTSFETGYRWSLVGGDVGKYRSDVNFGNGLRLLGSSFTANSRDGHGKYFDEIVLNTQGLGNDPYESAVLRIQKNGLYRYDMMWRSNSYYNPGLIPSAGEHLLDTNHRLQDHDLTLLPQSKLRFHLGYSRSSQDGPALSTIQAFDSRGDEFPLFMNVRRVSDEYRAGVDLNLMGFLITVQHRWDDFKEDTPYFINGTAQGNNPSDGTVLTSFRRSEPYHGTSPAWLGTINTNRKRFAISGRFNYVAGARGFVMDESTVGTERFNANNRQVLVAGSARRPVTTGDFSLSIFPTSRLTITNFTAVNNTRIDGDSYITEFDNATLTSQTILFRYLGVRTVSNTTAANYRASDWLTVYGRYGYSNRLVRTIEGFGFPDTGVQNQTYENSNTLQTGTLGARIRPVKPLTFTVDGEVGRADNPFTPVSGKNYHTINGRAEYRVKRWQASGTYRQTYNTNSAAVVTSFASHARNYSANASWFGRDWFSIDASYVKMHLDTLSGLAFFAGAPRSQLQSGYSSLYISNIHSANLGAHFDIAKRVDFLLGYTITRDVGDGRVSQVAANLADPIATGVLAPVQTFPLSFQAPLARVSVRLSSKLRWNAGWQFYRYREDFQLLSVFQNYRANTGYVSLLWSF